MKKERNYSFIDGQNLYMGLPWQFDFVRFRKYLKDKYNVTKAYYFIGFKGDENKLYEALQEAGFILIFNLKGENLQSNKKGNIDVTLAFYIMRNIIDNTMDKAVLVSGDGDYKIVVDYLIEVSKLKKVLAPNVKFASSLYKDSRLLKDIYFAILDEPGIREKIEYKYMHKKKRGT